MLNIAHISGTIGISYTITGDISPPYITGEIQIARHCIDPYPVYTGETVVTPRAYEQVLDTEDTIVLEDITVLEIPYTEVSNIYGGTTVSIG